MVAANRTIVTLAIIVLGLIFMFIGASIEPRIWYGVQWSTFIINLGLFLTGVESLQWVFDNTSRQNMLEEVVKFTIGNINISQSGLADFKHNSKDISYDDYSPINLP